MFTFKGIRTFDDLKAQVNTRNWMMDTTKFDTGGDWVVILFQSGQVQGHALVNTCSGRFFGETTTGIKFDSNHPTHDGQPWFDDLLNTVLEPLPATAAT